MCNPFSKYVGGLNSKPKTILKNFITLVLKPCLTLIFLISFIIGTVLFPPYKIFVCLCAKLLRTDLSHTLGFVSSTFSLENVSNNNNLKTNIFFVTIFDGALSLDKLVQLFDARVMKKRKSNGDFVYKELSMYWTTFLNYWFWKKDPEFDLRNHVRLYDYGGKAEDFELRLPSGEEGFCDEEHLRRVISPLLAKSWQPKRSPWELLLIQTFRRNGHHGDVECESKPCSALIFRLHHGVCDGYGFIKLIARDLLDKPLNIQINFPKANAIERIIQFLIFPVKFPWDVVGTVFDCLDSANTLINRGTVRNKFISKGFTSISKPISCQLIKNIKNKYGVDYNSVLFFVASQALRRVMGEAGQIVPKEVNCFIPFAVPNHPDGAVNHTMFYIFKMKMMKKQSRKNGLLEIAKERQPPKYYTFNYAYALGSKFLSFFPYVFIKWLQHARSAICMSSLTMCVDNHLCAELGVKLVDAFFALGPKAGLDVAVTMLSYNGYQRLLIRYEDVFADEKVLLRWSDFFEEELKELMTSS